MNDGPVQAESSWTVLARLLRPQGRKGEILADLLTDFPESLVERPSVSLRRPNGLVEVATVERHWLPVGKNAGRVVLKLQSVDSIEDAERISGYELVIPLEERIELDQDAEYITDLLDCTLYDSEHAIGIVEDVHFPAASTGGRLADAAPLLVVRSPEGDELLIPFAKAWIQRIDIPGKRIEMRLPEGLLDING